MNKLKLNIKHYLTNVHPIIRMFRAEEYIAYVYYISFTVFIYQNILFL